MVSDERFAHFFPPFGMKMSERRPDGRSTWYICKICRRAHPRYIADNRSWKQGGFRVGAVCKHCLEEKVPDAKYVSLEEYAKGQVAARKLFCAKFENRSFDVEKETRKFIESMKPTWDQPEEDVPPERTTDELEIMLSHGKCTIAYANSTKDVRAMCRLCTNETCQGPYMLGEWEDSEYKNIAHVVKQSMDLAKKTKAKPLKISKKRETPIRMNRENASAVLEFLEYIQKEGELESHHPEAMELINRLRSFLGKEAETFVG